MKGNLEPAIRLIYGSEGGYVNDPKDPGGPTKYGITLKTLQGYRGKPQSAADVRALGLQEASDIIASQYAYHIHFDELPAGLDYAMLDYAVNSGPAQASKSLQRILGVDHDGVIGGITLKEVTGHPASVLVRQLCDERMSFLQGLRTWKTYKNGWTNRVNHVRKVALDMTDDSSVIALVEPPSGDLGGKASPADTAILSAPGGKINATTVGTSAVAVAGSLGTALAPYSSVGYVQHVLIGCAIVGAVGAGIAGVFGLKLTNSRINDGVPQ